jgi:hypothetical protein
MQRRGGLVSFTQSLDPKTFPFFFLFVGSTLTNNTEVTLVQYSGCILASGIAGESWRPRFDSGYKLCEAVEVQSLSALEMFFVPLESF